MSVCYIRVPLEEQSAVEDYLRERGLSFVVIPEGMNCILESERAAHSQKVRDGIKRARAEGTVLGRPRKYSEKTDEIFRLRMLGLTFRRIGEELGIPPQLVHRIFNERNPGTMETVLADQVEQERRTLRKAREIL